VDASRLHWDLTSVSLYGAYPEAEAVLDAEAATDGWYALLMNLEPGQAGAAEVFRTRATTLSSAATASSKARSRLPPLFPPASRPICWTSSPSISAGPAGSPSEIPCAKNQAWVLWALLRRGRGRRTATVVSSVLFGLWHVLPSLGLAADEAVGTVVGRGASGQVMSVLGTVLFTGLAEVVFCELRRLGGSLLASAGLHWAVNGLGVLAAAVWAWGSR